MGIILQFRRSNPYAPLIISNDDLHYVTVKIVDPRRPKEARWHMQWPIQRAASSAALKGFTNVCARNQTRHSFEIRGARLLKRFLRDVEDLVCTNRVIIIVDKARVRTKVKKAA